jgi:hypothetical protein
MPAIAPITAAAAGDNAVVAAVTGKKIRVRGFAVYNGVATVQNAKWRSGTTDITGLLYGAAAIGLLASGQAPANDFLFETVAGQALNLNLSAATVTGGWVVYTLE